MTTNENQEKIQKKIQREMKKKSEQREIHLFISQYFRHSMFIVSFIFFFLLVLGFFGLIGFRKRIDFTEKFNYNY